MVSTGQGLLGYNMFTYCNNEPVFYADYTGNVATTINNRYNYNVDSTQGGGGVIILPLVDSIEEIIESTATMIRSMAEAASNTVNRRDNCVYVLKDPNDGYKVKYVGRTNDPVRRLREHNHDLLHPERKYYTMTVLVSGLTKREAMLYEQIFISAYTLDYLENARREIAVGNLPAYESYLGAAASILGGVTEEVLYALLGR